MLDRENDIVIPRLFDRSPIAAIGFDLQKHVIYSNAAARAYPELEDRLLEQDAGEFEVAPGVWLGCDRVALPDGTLCICRDISTFRGDLELGRLARRFAHDFNNLLGLIAGYAQLAQRGASPEKTAVYLEEILKSTGTAVSLTGQLLAAKRGLVSEASRFELGELLRRLLEKLADSIAVRLRLDPVLPPVLANRAAVAQLLDDLIRRFSETMPLGGELSVEAQVDDDKIRLRFADNGIEWTSGIATLPAILHTFIPGEGNVFEIELPLAPS